MAGHNSRDQSIRFSATLSHMVNVSKGEKVIIVFFFANISFKVVAESRDNTV